MAKSVGEIALDIVLGKESFSSSIKNAVSECAKTLNNSSATIGQKINSVGNCVSGLGATILPVSTAIGGLGVTIGKMSMNFEDAMAKVSTIANTTEVPLDTLKEQIMKLSTQTGISASEIADNVYNAISAGQKTGDAVNFVSNATKLAKAGFTSSASSLDVLTTIMNAYGLEAEKVTDVSDMLIQTQNLGKTTVDELSSSMGKVIPTANSMNVGLDNLCASYSIMTAKGIATAESTTYINSMLNELGKSSTTVGGIIKDKTGMSFQECMASGMSLGDVLQILQNYSDETGIAFNELWGSAEAGKAGISLLSDGVDSFNSRLGEMNNSTGMTDVAFDKMQTTSYSLEKSINQIKNVAIQLGDTLMKTLGPIIEQVCGKISQFTEWFSKLDDGTKNTIVKIGLFVACLGPVLIGVGKVISLFSSIVSIFSAVSGAIGGVSGALALLTGPVGIVIASVVGLIAVFTALWKNNEDFRNKITALWEQVKVMFMSVFEQIKSVVSTAMEFIKVVIDVAVNAISWIWDNFGQNIMNGIMIVFETIKGIISGALNVIQGIIKTVTSLIKGDWDGVWDGIKQTLSGVWETIKSVVTGAINAVKNTISTYLKAISLIFSNIFNGIKNTVINVFNNMKNGISNTIGNIKNAIVSGFTNAINWIKSLPSQAWNWGADIISNIANGIKGAVGKVTNAVKGVADKIKSFLHFSEPDVGPLSDFHTYMPDMMDLMSKGIKNNTGEVMKAVNGLASQMSNALCIEADTPEIKATSASTSQVASQSKNASTNDSLSARLDSMMTLMTQLLSNKQVSTDTGDITIPVYIGNTAIDEIIVTAQQRRTMRSGGKS